MKYYTESPGLEKFPADKVVGFLVAEDFQNTCRKRMNYPGSDVPVSLCFRQRAPPRFRRSILLIPEQVPERPTRKRVSELLHWKIIEGTMVDDLKPVFRAAIRCFLNDDHRRWIVVNPKGGHIAVHYKGQRFLCVWPDRESFCVPGRETTCSRSPV